ncbi:MAG: GMC family oxidoreductase [Mycobacterium sp.]|nr:GMC family oxidoreductase [Mycobacterium sp.]
MNFEGERIIVIGSGPSGAMAAQTLVQDGAPVTMLESGTHLPDGALVRVMGRNVFRRRANATTASRDSRWLQSLVPGGLSNYWAGASPRFSPEDFVEGERLHERYHWPVEYSDLVGYYERAERVLRLVGDPTDVPHLPAPVVLRRRTLPCGWQYVARVAAAAGRGLAPMPLADGPDWLISRTGVGFNSFMHVVRPLLHRPNFDLRLGAHAIKLEWCGTSRRVTSVVYRNRLTGEDERIAAAGVVVAAGPHASTGLLLNSSCSDFPEGLGNTDGLLGHFLHEHPSQWFPIELKQGGLPRLAQAAYLTRGPVVSSDPLLAGGSTIGFASTRDKLRSALPGLTNAFGVIVFGTMVPLASNTLDLDPRETDEFGLPTVRPNIRYAADELRNLEHVRRALGDILDAAGYPCSVPRCVADPIPGTSVHYGGTVRMHASPRYGVLNGWSRMHAVDNVVVADASAFTTGVEKNPTLTAMALAARGAERLAHDLKAA